MPSAGLPSSTIGMYIQLMLIYNSLNSWRDGMVTYRRSRSHSKYFFEVLPLKVWQSWHRHRPYTSKLKLPFSCEAYIYLICPKFGFFFVQQLALSIEAVLVDSA